MQRPMTRRLFLADLGKGGAAVLVLSLVACSDATGGGDITIGDGSPTTADPTTSLSPGTSAPETTPPAGASADLEWHRVSFGFVSAYVLVRQGEAAVVDTGSTGSAPDIEAALSEIGLGWDAVGHVILTHKHDDHAGSVTEVLELADAATGYAGADDIGSITAPRPLTPVADGDRVFDLEIIATPGHTPGHVCVLDSTIGLLVAGDALRVEGGVVAGPNASFTEDLTQAHESVRKLAGFQFEVLVVGHGDPDRDQCLAAGRRVCCWPLTRSAANQVVRPFPGLSLGSAARCAAGTSRSRARSRPSMTRAAHAEDRWPWTPGRQMSQRAPGPRHPDQRPG